MIANPQFRYVVHYGRNLSTFTATSWREAARFVKHCLDEGTAVTAIEKVPA